MAIDLSNYVRVGRYDLPEPTRTAAPSGNLLAQEASGVTYNWDTNTLFIVGDGGTSVTQVSLTGQLINTMTLAQGNSPQGTEFYDTESITYVGNGKFVFTEERDRQIVQFTYDAGTTLTRANAQTVDLGTNIGNVGLEGVSYDPLSGGFILVKEKTPLGIFQTTADFAHGTASNGSATTTDSINLFDPALLGLSDFSDVYALSSNPNIIGTSEQGNLLILSQESGKIVEVDRDGHILSSLTLQAPSTPSGIDLAAMTVEGMTMGPDGTIYLVSEEGGGDFDHPQLWVYAPAATTNAAPTALALSNATTSILENTSTASRVKVADIVLTDDGLGTNVFTVTGADAAYFEADSSGLYIKAGTVLDYETKTSYSVTVNVDDASVGGTPDASTNYALNVTNVVNEGGTGTHLIFSEVAPWSSGNSPIGVDWFEITNTGSEAVNIAGWKIDDDSASFGSAVALNGITTIAAGESVIFLEGNASNVAAFKSLWFGSNVPAGLQVGTYSGSGIGLSTGGDQLNLYNAAGALQAKVIFGASDPSAPWQTFDNAAGINNGTISTLSANGVNGAFTINPPTMGSEIGSPGTIGGVAAPVNHAPTAIGLSSEITSLAENTSTATRIKVADIVVTDDGLGTNTLSVSGADASFFEADSTGLYIKAGTVLDFETKANYAVTVNVDDASLGNSPDASVNFSLTLTDVAEGPQPTVRITEVAPWSSGNSPIGADWFEVTNTGSIDVNLNGWKMDDNSNAFGNAVALNGIGNVAVGESVIFIEVPSGSSAAQIAAIKAAFIDTWFGGHAPVNLQIGTYGGSGVGLSTGGDAVNLYNGSGVLQANVTFGVSPTGPYQTFDNTAGLDNAAITTVSSVGANGAFAAAHDSAEVGSPGGDLVLSNNGPLFTSASTFSVEENQTGAAHLTATDADGDHLTYSISGGLDADLFTIDAETGVISFKAAPNFEAPGDANHDNVYEIDVAVDDGHGLVGEDSIKVTVGNVNEGPALTGSQSALASGTEDMAYVVSAASLLQGFTDVDGDALSVVGLTADHGVVVDNHDGTFTITPAANYSGAVSLSYTVSDGNGGSLAASLGFNLAAVNDAPTALALSNSTIAEQRPNNTLVGTLIPTDVDNASGFTYSLLDSAGGRFYLNATTGQVFVGNGSLLDYEASTHYTIDVQVKDAAGATYHQQLTINLTNVVENQSYAGTAAANVFTAPTEDNWTVDGKGGADVITTLSGNDTIFAGAGNDTVHTGGGNDVIYFTGAGGGFDAVDGGAGNDTLQANAVNTVIGLSSISGIETISAGGFAGVKIQGTTLDDVLDFTGTTLVGITSINGGTGNDTLTGSAGDDHIDGGLGTDILAGGAGNDTFVFTAAGHTKNGSAFADHITDFALGDLIDLSTIDANGTLAGNQAFTFIGEAAFTGVGQLRIGMDGGHVAIFGNISGNANAEFEIILDNNHAMQAADFIL